MYMCYYSRVTALHDDSPTLPSVIFLTASAVQTLSVAGSYFTPMIVWDRAIISSLRDVKNTRGGAGEGRCPIGGLVTWQRYSNHL